MADAEKLVRNIRFVTVTRSDGRVDRTIMTFTSDEGMVERLTQRWRLLRSLEARRR